MKLNVSDLPTLGSLAQLPHLSLSVSQCLCRDYKEFGQGCQIVYLSELSMQHLSVKCFEYLVCPPLEINSISSLMLPVEKLQRDSPHASNRYDSDTQFNLQVEILIHPSLFFGLVDFEELRFICR